MQCSKCIPNFVGDPRNERACYKSIDISFPETVESAVEMSFFAVKALRYDVNIRIFVDVIVGNFDVYVSESHEHFKANSTVIDIPFYNHGYVHNASKETFTRAEYGGKILFLTHLYRRAVITIRYELLSDMDQFYIALKPINRTSDRYEALVYYRQDPPQLDGISIFLVLFVNILFIISVAVAYTRCRRVIRENHIIGVHDNELETMRSRPFSAFKVLLLSNVHENHRNWTRGNLALMTGQNNKSVVYPSSKARSRRARIMPVAVQNTTDEQAAIFSSFVQFPANDISSYNFSIGCGICCLSESRVLLRRTSSARPRRTTYYEGQAFHTEF